MRRPVAHVRQTPIFEVVPPFTFAEGPVRQDWWRRGDLYVTGCIDTAGTRLVVPLAWRGQALAPRVFVWSCHVGCATDMEVVDRLAELVQPRSMAA